MASDWTQIGKQVAQQEMAFNSESPFAKPDWANPKSPNYDHMRLMATIIKMEQGERMARQRRAVALARQECEFPGLDA